MKELIAGQGNPGEDGDLGFMPLQVTIYFLSS